MAQQQLWVKNQRKRKRAAGEAYINTKGAVAPAKCPKPSDCSKCKLQCDIKISEEKRRELFDYYYQLKDYWKQRNYICTSVDKLPTEARSHCKGKRLYSAKYSFIIDGNKLYVCRKFFLKTLDVSEKLVRLALQEKTPEGGYGGEDSRGKCRKRDPEFEEKKRQVREHIASYPAVESHYVRKDSKRKFLEAGLNIAKMYDHYVEKCGLEAPAVNPVSNYVFREIFNKEFNLAFHRPKKDQCGTCEKFNHLQSAQKATAQEAFDQHMKNKLDARLAKNNDKERATQDKTFRSISFDLQAVLYTPCSNVSTLFYKLKLSAYNFTIFEQAQPHDGYCYFWNETEGKTRLK